LTVSSVIFDSLQQPPIGTSLWTKDGPGRLGPDGEWGYNFAATIGSSNFTVARSGHMHLLQVLFTPASGETFRANFSFDTLKIFSATNLS
jgi:hypothetical protein